MSSHQIKALLFLAVLGLLVGSQSLGAQDFGAAAEPPPTDTVSEMESQRFQTALSFFLGLLTVVSTGIAIHQYYRANQQHNLAIQQQRQAQQNAQRLQQLEKAVTSYEYLKKRGLQLYSNGSYGESLDVLRKYYLDNDDKLDLKSVIDSFLWGEARKLYPEKIAKKSSVQELVIAQLLGPEAKGGFSPVISELLALYERKFDETLAEYLLILDLAKGDYGSAAERVLACRFFKDKAQSLAFENYVEVAITSKKRISAESSEEGGGEASDGAKQ